MNQRGVSNHHSDSKRFRKCPPITPALPGITGPQGLSQSGVETPKAVHTLGLLHPSPISKALLHFQKQLALSYCRYKSLWHPFQGDSHFWIMYFVPGSEQVGLPPPQKGQDSCAHQQVLSSEAASWAQQTSWDMGCSLGHSQWGNGTPTEVPRPGAY